MTDVSIRAAGPNDLDAVLALLKHLNAGDELAETSAAPGIWTRLISSPDNAVLLGEIAGVPVTTCTLLITPNLTRAGRSFAVIENVVTNPAFRNRGFGKAVLKEAISRAQVAGCYKIVLTTGSSRESTLAFYEKVGFRRNTRTVFEIRVS